MVVGLLAMLEAKAQEAWRRFQVGAWKRGQRGGASDTGGKDEVPESGDNGSKLELAAGGTKRCSRAFISG